MKVTTEDLGRCETLMTVEAEPADEQKLLKKAAQRISRQVQIPGFRPGKAPYNTVVRRYGLEAVQQEVLDHSSEKIITDALSDVELEPQAPMSLEDVSWEPLTLKVKVPTEPVIELGEYRDIRLESEPVEVTDEDVDEALKAMQEQNATWAPVERASEIGDLLTFSVKEKDGDEVLNEQESVEFELNELEEDADDDAQRLDFTTPLLGLSADESKTFTITYPEDYQAEQYAGKEITFEVEASSVKAKELDPLDDDFAQSMGEFETLDALKEQLHSSIEERRQHEADQETGREMLDKIMEDAETIEWPEALEEYRLDQEIGGVEQQLKQSSLTLDSFLQMQNKTEEEFREETRERVVSDLKMGIILSELSKLEQLEVSQVEILERARAMAEMSGAGDQFWQNVLSSSQTRARIASEMLTDKVFERLAAIARGDAPEPGAEPEVEEVAEVEESVDESSEEVEVSSENEAPAEEEPSVEEEPSPEDDASSDEEDSSEVAAAEEEKA